MTLEQIPGQTPESLESRLTPEQIRAQETLQRELTSDEWKIFVRLSDQAVNREGYEAAVAELNKMEEARIIAGQTNPEEILADRVIEPTTLNLPQGRAIQITRDMRGQIIFTIVS